MTTYTPLQLEDIQGGVLHPLPCPYVGVFTLLRIDNAAAGRELLAQLIPSLRTAEEPASPDADAWLSVALTYKGLQALGVPPASLDSFDPEFRAGMAARADRLHDIGESAPANWEEPLRSPDIHVVLTSMAPDQERLDTQLERAEAMVSRVGGITVLYRLDCRSSDGREPFGFQDNISHPAVEGSGIPGSNPKEEPLKAGEFILGYPDESGRIPPVPQPAVLGHNGSYLVIRKLHQRVAAFRRYVREQASASDDEELVAAKIMGRWPSGAPLTLAPEQDDPDLGSDPARNNDFAYKADADERGLKCPVGSHVRRMNPRDADVVGNPRRHRLLRREVVYGPTLPEGVVEDDAVDRGMIFACVGASLRRQFEFVQEEWVNSGIFIGHGLEKDPLCGANQGDGVFTVPERPIRRRLSELPTFVVTRGGDYFFMPSFTALRWLSRLTD
ncbi:Dyp-type peroxidase [Streptomyces sp. NPDC059957]|uniref:Dyp-type peroxidase n=1 Tax=unclassified Streptomyces TaxID=2593676 RepID=UPI0036648974